MAIKTDLFVERGGGSGKDSLAQAVRKEWKLEKKRRQVKKINNDVAKDTSWSGMDI